MTGFTRTARPKTTGELAALVAGTDGSVAYIAGGTDLVIALEQGLRADLIIDISKMDALDFVDVGRNSIRIGAVTPVSALARHTELRKSLTALTHAATQFGSEQIRNRATIGGNIASPVPPGDLLPVLKCLDCRVEVLHRGQTRTIRTFDEVVIGHGQTSLGNGDLITAVNVPQRFGPNQISAFGKIGRRRELTIARLNLAVLADYEPNINRINDIHIVAGAIGPVPIRLQNIEQELRGRAVDQTLADDFLRLLADAVDAAIPGRASQAYKRRAVMGLGLDVLHSLFGRKYELSGSLVEMA